MTINITSEIKAAYEVYLDGVIDADVLGSPIRRRDCAGWDGLVQFAAGYQAALGLPIQETKKRFAELKSILVRAHPEDSTYEPIISHMCGLIERGLAAISLSNAVDSFQPRVQPWLLACFGAEIASNREERNHRFLEESLELVQACGCTANEAHQLVDYVFGRSVGDPKQEVGGVMTTLAALCLAHGFDMHSAAETELARIWTMVDVIRAKQAAKPKHSPLPGSATSDSSELAR